MKSTETHGFLRVSGCKNTAGDVGLCGKSHRRIKKLWGFRVYGETASLPEWGRWAALKWDN